MGVPPRMDDDEGATAAEYGILLAFIVFVVVVGVGAFGQALSGYLTGLALELQGWLS